MDTKKCNECKKILSIDQFGKYPPSHRKHTQNIHYPRCRECRREYLYKWRTENRDKFMAHNRKWFFRTKYGLTAERYNDLYKRQGRGCAICGGNNESHKRQGLGLAVDHDHVTGRVRGLLCDSCNRGIGHLKSVENMQRAIKYIGAK